MVFFAQNMPFLKDYFSIVLDLNLVESSSGQASSMYLNIFTYVHTYKMNV